MSSELLWGKGGQDSKRVQRTHAINTRHTIITQEQHVARPDATLALCTGARQQELMPK